MALTPDLLVYGLTTPAEPRLSRDGRRIVYTLTTTDRVARRARSQLWLRDVDGANPRQLTASGDRNRAPDWSPDGRSIAFVSDRAKQSGIFVLPVAEPGGARELLREPREIGDLAWSPDGHRSSTSSRSTAPATSATAGRTRSSAARRTRTSSGTRPTHPRPSPTGPGRRR